MKKKSDEVVRACEFCRYSAPVQTTEDMLCDYKGVVHKEYFCRKFVYDPLKRVPRRQPELVVPEEMVPEDK